MQDVLQAANANRVRLVQILLAHGADVHAAAAGPEVWTIHNVVFCFLTCALSPFFHCLLRSKELRFVCELICHYVVQPCCVMQTQKLESDEDQWRFASLQVAIMRMCLEQAHKSYTVTG